MRDSAAVRRYMEWFLTPRGHYAFGVQCHLIQHMVAPWPRRGQRLLQIGCGSGLFLEGLYDAGFDITGVDQSQSMIKEARLRLGNKADLHLSNITHLPFDDDEFDYVALLTVLEFANFPEKILSEAMRVAKYGLVLSYLNPFSFQYLSHGSFLCRNKDNPLYASNWFTYGDILKMLIKHVPPRNIFTRSALPGPVWSWRSSIPCRWINNQIYPPYIGSFNVARVDFKNRPVQTPLVLFKTGTELTN